MKNNRNKLFLYGGLFFLGIAIILRWQGVSYFYWIPPFFLAIGLKVIFLFNIFREKEFKLTLWLTLILIGVALIFISLLFKYVFYLPLVRQILFYSAISLKVVGLIVMLVGRIRNARKNKDLPA